MKWICCIYSMLHGLEYDSEGVLICQFLVILISKAIFG